MEEKPDYIERHIDAMANRALFAGLPDEEVTKKRDEHVWEYKYPGYEEDDQFNL